MRVAPLGQASQENAKMDACTVSCPEGSITRMALLFYGVEESPIA